VAAVPNDGLEFRTAPVRACRIGSGLASRAAIFDWSKVRSFFGFSSFFGSTLVSFFSTGFFCCSFFRASAIGSPCCSFFSTGFGGSGFFSGGCGSGGLSLAAMTSFFSVTLPTGSSTGFGSPTFSAIGLGFSLLPLLIPLVICDSCSDEMMSTGNASCGLASSERVEKDMIPQPSTPTWRASEAASDLSISYPAIFKLLGPLLHLSDQCHALEAGRGQATHDPHDRAVVDFLVAAHEDPLVHAAASG